MINKIKKQLKGFTLIETLVAVLLLTTAIAGPLTVASKSLLAALVAKDQVTAFFLAQDAIEFVRFARDTNKLQGSDWLAGTGVDLSNCEGADGCYIDTLSASVPTACLGACPVLRYHTTNKHFTYGTGSDTIETIFRRTINLATPVDGNNDEALLEVVVEWSNTAGTTGAGCSTGTRCVIVQENIFNWQ